MAKKGKKAKGKVIKPRSGNRLEAKVKGYLKQGKWGEFLTLYLRQHAKLHKGDIATVLDKAVYNGLATAVFMDKDVQLVRTLVDTILKMPDISTDSRSIARVVHLYLQARLGQDVRSELSALGDVLGPFAKLRDELLRIQEESGNTLDRFLNDPPKRCRKAEMGYAQAAKFRNHYLQKILATGPSLKSVTPFTQWQKLLDGFQADYASGSGGGLKDAGIIIELMRMACRKRSMLEDPVDVVEQLDRMKFGYSGHALVRQLLSLFIAMGVRRWGEHWGNEIRADLRYNFGIDELSSPGAREQMHIIRKMTDSNDPDNEDDTFAPEEVYGALLEHASLTWRERVLATLGLLGSTNDALEIEMEMSLSFMVNGPKRKVDYAAVQKRACYRYFDMLVMFKKLEVEGSFAGKLAAHLFHRVVLHETQEMSEWLEGFLEECLSVPLASATRAILTAKAIQHYFDGHEHPFVLHAVKQTPQPLTEDDISDLIGTIRPGMDYGQLFGLWEKMLLPQDCRAVYEGFAEQHIWSCAVEKGINRMMIRQLWDITPDELLQALAPRLGDQYHLKGFVQMTARIDRNSLPMNEKQAKPLLDNLPDHKTLHALLLWMLTWDVDSDYGLTFLCEIIAVLDEYCSGSEKWSELAETVWNEKHVVVAKFIWQLWAEKGHISGLKTGDFKRAMNLLGKYRPKPKKNKGGKTQKKLPIRKK